MIKMNKRIKRCFLTAIILINLVNVLYAQKIYQQVSERAEQLRPQLIEWRRYLHEHPELSNREFKTAAYIEAYLRKLGLEVHTNIAKTGVVGILKGGKPGPVVALRSDMDALPVKERTNLPFASKVTAEYLGETVPVMHACGHDAHMAIMMGTATVLNAMKKDVPGTVKFIFQPAEEGPPGDEEGGASLMVKEGVMDNPKVDAIFGLHIDALTPIGEIKYKPGAEMAASDWLTIRVHGKQTHGSQPWSGVDPVVIAAQIIEGLQTIVSRQLNISKAPVVISIGKIHAGVRSNIIPEELVMEGTIRTLDKEMHEDVKELIKKTVTHIAQAGGATAEVSVDTKTEVTFNNPELVTKMLPSLQRAVGKDKVYEMEWTTLAEDFSFYGNKAPAFFFFLGAMPAGQDPKKAAPHHTPDFFIDDSRLDAGVKAFCNIVFDYAKP